MSDPLKCPHCQAELDQIDLIGRLKKQSSISLRLHPKQGEAISANTLGATLLQFEKLLKAESESLDIKTTVAIDSVQTSEDGAIEVKFVLMRLQADDEAAA